MICCSTNLSFLAAAGGVCLLAAALDDTWKGAQGAFHVLWCLLDSELLPAHQVAMHEAELARLGGLRRCSALMCPPIYESDAQGMSGLKHGAMTAIVLHGMHKDLPYRTHTGQQSSRQI